jgi:hypothetical protein
MRAALLELHANDNREENFTFLQSGTCCASVAASSLNVHAQWHISNADIATSS